MEPYYADGTVTLWHGDCREITEWLAADVLVCDPPYGIHHSTHGSNAAAIAGEFKTGRASDRTLGPEHVAVRDAVLSMWLPKPSMVFGNWRAPRPVGTRFRIIWDKQVLGMGGVGAWRSSDEEIYIVGNWPNPRNAGGTQGSVVHMPPPRSAARPDHPTPKPVGLMELLLANCPPGVIADPFAGSGSTLVAARNLGRRAIGVELEERYCELIARRLSQDVLPLAA